MGKLRIANIWLIVLGLLIVGCNRDDSNDSANSEAKSKALRIVATTGMIKDAVENIVGDRANVEGLMGPGVDPHLYKATQGDLQKLMHAQIIFYNGLHLEGKMQSIFEKMSKQKDVIAISEVIDKGKLIVTFDGGGDNKDGVKTYDPHIWFSVPLWTEAVRYIGDKLQELDAANAEFYKKNVETYLGELGELHGVVQEELATIPKEQRLLITSHDAFGYFGQTYNLQVKGLQGISTVTEFGLKDVTQMVDLITEQKIRAIFVESSVASKPLEAVVAGCKERGHEVKIGGTLFSDAMGADGTPEGTYVGMVKHNVKTVVEGLK